MRPGVYLSICLVSCAPALSDRPTILLDSRIANEAVIEGLRSWDGAGVEPNIVVVPHDELVHTTRRADYVIALATPGMADCPLDDLRPAAAQTDMFSDGSVITCFDTDQIESARAPANEVKRAAAHELGHALGLPHLPESDSVMTASFAGNDTPTCSDFAHLSTVRDTKIPGGCRN